MRLAPWLLAALWLAPSGAALTTGLDVAVGLDAAGGMFEWRVSTIAATCEAIHVEMVPLPASLPPDATPVVWIWGKVDPEQLKWSAAEARAARWLPEDHDGWASARVIASPAFVLEEFQQGCWCGWDCWGHLYVRGTGAVSVCQWEADTWCQELRPPPELLALSG